jgi:hypothetical protein
MTHDLQTKLGHEGLARDEALATVRRLETEARVAAHAQETVEAKLAAECLAHRITEVALVEALEGRQEAERTAAACNDRPYRSQAVQAIDDAQGGGWTIGRSKR